MELFICYLPYVPYVISPQIMTTNTLWSNMYTLRLQQQQQKCIAFKIYLKYSCFQSQISVCLLPILFHQQLEFLSSTKQIEFFAVPLIVKYVVIFQMAVINLFYSNKCNKLSEKRIYTIALKITSSLLYFE